MSTVAKILIVVNLALAALFVGSASTYLGNLDHWKTKHDLAVQDLDQQLQAQKKLTTQAEGERDTARNSLVETQKELATRTKAEGLLATENQAMRSAYDAKTAQLTRATAALERLTATVDSNRQLIDQLQSENGRLNEALNTVQQARNAAIEQVARLDMQLQNETEKTKALEGRVSDMGTSLERAQFEIATWHKRYPGDEIMGAEQPSHSGMVLAANDGANVVVISLGAEDGVKEGFQYVLSRGDKYVATIKINDVQAKQSAGFSMRDVQQSAPQKGDRASSK